MPAPREFAAPDSQARGISMSRRSFANAALFGDLIAMRKGSCRPPFNPETDFQAGCQQIRA